MTSTEVEFVDEKEFEYAMSQVRSDTAPEQFLIIAHEDGSPNTIRLVCTGTDTAEIPNHLNDEEIMYILSRYTATFDMSQTVKFVIIRWMGESVPMMKRAKFGVVNGSVQTKMGQHHARLETGSADDITDDSIQQRLAETAGNVSRVLESTEGHQERGFTASQTTKKAPPSTGLMKSSFTETKPDVEIDEEVLEMLNSVHNDMEQNTWCLGRYDDNRMKGPIRKVATGNGDLMELKSNLDDSLIMYGLYRVMDVVDDIQTIKFAFIMWIGPDVKPFVKAKVSTHRGVIEETFKPVHVVVIASELSEISDKIVMNKVMSASGSKSWVK